MTSEAKPVNYMKFTRTIEAAQEGFPERALEDDLTDYVSDLPLDELCADGGWPEGEHIKVISFKKVKGMFVAVAEVEFSEVQPTGCSDISFSHGRFAVLDITIERATGEATIELDLERSIIDVEGSGDVY